MKAATPDRYSSNILRKYAFVLVGWSVLVAMSLAWNIQQERGETIHMAIATARANINKDFSFRKWVASHGGVYVVPSERTPPNPYLNVPDRDVVTTTGKALTLMNPAYALREMQNYFGDYYGIRSHITSLKPLNPRNAADAWEAGALKRFEQNSEEIMEVQQIDSQPYLRMMAPFVVEPDCLKCHANQGYKIGDIRGGIGTDVSLTAYLADERKRNTTTIGSHGLIWLIGLLGSVFFYRRECYLDNERSKVEAILRESENQFRTIANSTPIMIWMSGTDKLCNFFNKGWLEFTGRSLEQEAGNGWAEGVHPDDLKNCFDTYVNAFDARQEFRMEYRLRRYDGEYRWLVDCGAPRFDSTGRFIGYIGNCIDITDRKQAEEEIKSLAFYDPLTHLPNRRLLMDRLKQALASSARSGRKGALLFIDLDKFKTLNDTLGHDIGDLLLQQVAQRLESCVREGDTVARLGGDEFVVMLEDLSENNIEAAAQAEVVGEKIIVTLNQPYQLAAHEHHSTPSIGVSLFSGSVLGQEELLQQADIAMYQAKKAGRNVLRFFDPAMQATITARAIQEADLRRAVAEQEKFTLYYQAQIDSSGRLIGAEALVRWQHPEHGMMLPGEFIPLAEETGLILPLGHWVLTAACKQLVAWAAQPETAHLTLAVNVSAKQIHLPTFVEEVLTLVDHFGVDPTKLKLEITESMLLDNVDATIANMAILKARGISFSMDDFGTGYSSLQYLKRLPLDQLKIDRSFVHDIATDNNDKAIVDTIIAMAKNLNLNIIAEGVETVAQQQLLKDKGCTAFQGYLLGRPIPIEQFGA
ncbi:MAG: EAL domain-containing protein, partial [Gallionella sp.]